MKTEAELLEKWNKLKSELPEKGTREYVIGLHNIVNEMKEFPRKSDAKITIICDYCEHYMKMWEARHHKNFKAEDIFKIRLPKWIKNMEED